MEPAGREVEVKGPPTDTASPAAGEEMINPYRLKTSMRVLNLHEVPQFS